VGGMCDFFFFFLVGLSATAWVRCIENPEGGGKFTD
jgi:hypothetical protein